MEWLRSRRPGTLYSAVIAAFLFSRILYYLITTAGEYRLFKSYGDDVRSSSLGALYQNRQIEYPHLSVGWGAAVGYVADHTPSFLKHTVRWRPNKFEWPYVEEPEAKRDAEDQYEAAIGLMLFAIDAWCFWLVFAIIRRTYPDEEPLARAGRLLLYVLSTSTCGLILFDRQDLLVAWSALLAMWCLAARCPRLGYAVLALGTAYKLVPVLLLPVWVIAAATVKCGPAPTFNRWFRTIVVEALIAAAFLSLWPILTYTHGGGERGFFYLTWHSQRGLQLEAPAAFPVLLLDSSVEFSSSYGSFNLVGEAPDRVAKVMGVLMPLTALLGMGVAALGFWKRRSPAPALPALMPHVVQSTMLIWVAFIAFNKVGSPQYLLWIAPLVPLLPLKTAAERSWVALLVSSMIATMLIYPCFYSLELVGPFLSEEPLRWRGPSTLGVALLGLKSVTLLPASVWYAVLKLREGEAPAEPR